MTALLRSINPSHNRSSSLIISTINKTSEDGEARRNLYFQQGPSLAESTMQRYNGNNDSSDNQQQSNLHHNQVDTRKHSTTGLQHLYNKDRDFLSRFPLGFKGCYNCGDTTHFRTRDCPSTNSGNFDKMTFFAEIWAHKPHTKNTDEVRQSGQPRQTGNINVTKIYPRAGDNNSNLSCYQNRGSNHNSNNNYHNNNHGT